MTAFMLYFLHTIIRKKGKKMISDKNLHIVTLFTVLLMLALFLIMAANGMLSKSSREKEKAELRRLQAVEKMYKDHIQMDIWRKEF